LGETARGLLEYLSEMWLDGYNQSALSTANDSTARQRLDAMCCTVVVVTVDEGDGGKGG